MKEGFRLPGWDKLSKKLLSWGMVLVGNCLLAFSVAMFLQHTNIAAGGVTGMALALESLTNVPASIYSLGLNIIAWIAGAFLLGREFAFSTLLSTFSYPLFWRMFEVLLKGKVLTTDPLLCSVFSGLLMGISLGIVMRENSSTGGVDVIPLALNKFFNAPIGFTMYAVDFLVILSQALLHPVECILYGIIHILVCAVVLDKVLVFGKTRIEVKVISAKNELIRDAIMSEMDRGVTMLKASGGYLKTDTAVVLSIISNRELPRIKHLVQRVDPEALVVVNTISEVSGRGFTMGKRYR